MFVPSSTWTLTTSSANIAKNSVQQKVQLAIKMTRQMACNITAAHEACRLWNDILLVATNAPPLDTEEDPASQHQQQQQLEQPPAIQALCLALYASCLVRTGQDQMALSVYDQALHLETHSENRHRLFQAKAQSLQRLLRYEEAADCFLVQQQQHAEEINIMGAVTCLLRQAKWNQAKCLLRDFVLDNKQNATEATAMYATLVVAEQLVKNETSSLPFIDDEMILAIQKAHILSPFFKWMSSRIALTDEASVKLSAKFDQKEDKPLCTYSFLDYCSMNIGALDDPLLIHMDDKVLLHRLLTQTPEVLNMTHHFWPEGFVWSGLDEDDAFIQQLRDKDNVLVKFIIKNRAGYGSHGNTIVNNLHEVTELMPAALKTATINRFDSEKLIQRVVEPALLLQGHKFSLRVYVILFGPDEAYISDQGLVKLAAETVSDDEGATKNPDGTPSPRKYMTNSGREAFMRQESLDFLRDELSSESSFDQLWESIINATCGLLHVYNRFMDTYLQDNNALAMRQRIQAIGIPKILGLDFVVDSSSQAWLIEVNRFPGLEPRDEGQDADIKRRVVLDAWNLAKKRVIEEKKTSSSLFEWLDGDIYRMMTNESFPASCWKPLPTNVR